LSKLKVALVNVGFEQGEKGIIVSPPLGIMSIGAFLRQNGWEVKIFDWSGEPLDDSMRSALASFAPEIVGLTVIIGSSIIRSKAATLWVKDIGAKVVWGGPFPSALPEMCLRQSKADFVVFGEGEMTMLDLCTSIQEGEPTSEVKGIAYLEGDELKKSPPRQRVLDLNELPMPWWESILPLDKYLIPFHGRMAIPMVTSRGCPGTCTFCYTKYMWGYRWTSRSASKVVEEIEHLRRLDPRIGGAIFDDDLFAGDVERIQEFCAELNEKGLDILWNCEIRARDLKEPLVEIMKRGGCVDMLVGVETGSDRLLANVLKGVKKSDIIEAFRVIHKVGVSGVAMLMVGMPGETIEDFDDTEKLLEELKADGYYFSMFLPTPGTEFLQVAKTYGFKEPQTMEEWAVLGGYGISSYSERSLSQVPWKRVDRMIKRENRRIRNRNNWQAVRKDPTGAIYRGLLGKVGNEKD